MPKSTDDLIRIAAAGGGVQIDAGLWSTNDLIRIAAAASNKGARLVLTNSASISTDDMIRIGAAGKGSVLFQDWIAVTSDIDIYRTASVLIHEHGDEADMVAAECAERDCRTLGSLV